MLYNNGSADSNNKSLRLAKHSLDDFCIFIIKLENGGLVQVVELQVVIVYIHAATPEQQQTNSVIEFWFEIFAGRAREQQKQQDNKGSTTCFMPAYNHMVELYADR